MGSWAERIHGKAAAGGSSEAADCGVGQVRRQLVGSARRWMVEQVVPYSHADKPGETTGKQEGLHNPWLQHGEINTGGGCSARRNSRPHRRVCWRDPQGPRMYTNPPGNQHQKGPVCGQRGKWLKTVREWSKHHCSFLDPSPTYSITTQHVGCFALANT